MDSIVQEFLKTHRIAVLGLAQEDGTIHSASLHYAYQPDPLQFYFATEKHSYKCRPLLNNQPRNASLVIGFNEEEFVTVQASGLVQIAPVESLTPGWELFLAKFPQRAALKNDEDVALLQFTPTWWRYRDYKVRPPREVSNAS